MRRSLIAVVAAFGVMLFVNGCTVGDPPYSYPGQQWSSDAGAGQQDLTKDSGPGGPTGQDAGTVTPPPPPPSGQDAGTTPPPPPPPPSNQDAGTPTPVAVCGNGILEAGEQCDDGNTVSGDGCSSTCQIEAASSCGATKTLSGDVQPVLTSRCGGCHGLFFPQRGLNLSSGSTYGTLVGVSSGCGAKPYVDPGNPNNSYLINALTGTGLCLGDGKMPQGGSLAQSDIDTIRAWICEGAQND